MKQILLISIKIYQKILSPFLGGRCRFYPTCSVYAAKALEEKGVRKGMGLIAKRLLRCHPFHPGGYDPVPAHE
ncbi:MAG: membrane protein insertion efficiency factor YidD [Candidatus Omnitrophica bacterium CG11_big_fil_rev_8_21_14_0_20_45_26]|uniref:Putative membrane protein insertion efficiency factor n=1 Tax=Candidatus Abzuiibacterium crystallinum TaxID=1974748 RepID=A0A2H0LNI9_9BACT|nr:MAG: membrane protein insertion efficiency factor YidD [Candidatus Omnitrophica bacterium CG11_big_fil_rev_8_21_14_0_20_45_26]PIW64726.1 MAG: membrane protein insertion efficiency factor YidD [Candidatus Omnitrophica bacterium CG12_big_fil_rev_8_21_14_0_65_45_16]